MITASRVDELVGYLRVLWPVFAAKGCSHNMSFTTGREVSKIFFSTPSTVLKVAISVKFRQLGDRKAAPAVQLNDSL